MTIDELLARESIRHTIASYNIAGDSRRTDDYAATFAEDAISEFAGYPPVPGFRLEGRAAIHAAAKGWQKHDAPDVPARKLTFVRHHLTTSRIELTGAQTATARTYFMVYTDIGPDHAGVYDDVFRKTGDAWLIAHRNENPYPCRHHATNIFRTGIDGDVTTVRFYLFVNQITNNIPFAVSSGVVDAGIRRSADGLVFTFLTVVLDAEDSVPFAQHAAAASTQRA